MRPYLAGLRSINDTAELFEPDTLIKIYEPFFVSGYLDDFLGLSKSVPSTDALGYNIVQLAKLMGLRCHPAKCELNPSTHVEYLGVLLDIPN